MTVVMGDIFVRLILAEFGLSGEPENTSAA
jgi:hypothetical protein